jgi:hypothetical protein
VHPHASTLPRTAQAYDTLWELMPKDSQEIGGWSTAGASTLPLLSLWICLWEAMLVWSRGEGLVSWLFHWDQKTGQDITYCVC